MLMQDRETPEYFKKYFWLFVQKAVEVNNPSWEAFRGKTDTPTSFKIYTVLLVSHLLSLYLENRDADLMLRGGPLLN